MTTNALNQRGIIAPCDVREVTIGAQVGVEHRLQAVMVETDSGAEQTLLLDFFTITSGSTVHVLYGLDRYLMRAVREEGYFASERRLRLFVDTTMVVDVEVLPYTATTYAPQQKALDAYMLQGLLFGRMRSTLDAQSGLQRLRHTYMGADETISTVWHPSMEGYNETGTMPELRIRGLYLVHDCEGEYQVWGQWQLLEAIVKGVPVEHDGTVIWTWDVSPDVVEPLVSLPEGAYMKAYEVELSQPTGQSYSRLTRALYIMRVPRAQQPPFTVQFLNRWGVWDRCHFWGPCSADVESKTSQARMLDSCTRTYDIQNGTEVTLNAGFPVRVDELPAYQDLAQARTILDGDDRPMHLVKAEYAAPASAYSDPAATADRPQTTAVCVPVFTLAYDEQ